jgi:spoIIIJ-associated protein
VNHVALAKEILDTLLGYLGFVATIEIDTSRPEPCLQVFSAEGDLLLGERGDRIEDIQYLVNRLVQARDEKAPRVRVDVNHHRAISEDELIEEAERLAQRVLHGGKPAKLRPLNSYHRRIVHNHFLHHERIKTWSPPEEARYKQITLSLKDGGRRGVGSSE